MPVRIRRFSRTWRMQHFLLMTSVLLLILSGLSLRYSQTTLGKVIIFLEGGFQARGALHRLSAVLLMFTAVYHLGYILFTREGRREFRSLLVHGEDFVDLWNMILYDLGKRDQRPRFGRYSYREKFQYWAFAIFLLIMIVSGIILWFHNYFFSMFPKFLIDITIAVHSWTGTLLFLFLVLWHFYLVHLAPGNFPWNGSFWHGEVTEDWLRMYHPLEYEELRREG